MGEKPQNPRNVKPISLHPLTLEEALRRAMNAGKPREDEPDEQRPEDESRGDKPGREDEGRERSE